MLPSGANAFSLGNHTPEPVLSEWEAKENRKKEKVGFATLLTIFSALGVFARVLIARALLYRRRGRRVDDQAR